jgi:starch-binding outer membrane protein SusE/F
MKYFKNLLGLFLMSLVFFAACKKSELENKDASLQTFSVGNSPIISSSSTAVVPAPADSNNVALSFTWTNPNYAQDISLYKFVLQIDSSGRNFANAISKTITGVLTTSFTAKELNIIALSYGFNFNVAYDMDVRVISSYGNNNEPYVSNTIKLKYTPYLIPPILALPTTNRLFITGGGTAFGWTNPAPMPPARELTKINGTTWQGIFNLNSSDGYLLLPLAGDWNNKFSVPNGTLSGLADGGTFGFNFNDNFPTSFSGGNGWYKMTYDFQTAKFKATKEVNPLGADLYITGDATPSSWTNSPPASQKFIQKTNGVFEITMAFTPGKYFKFLDTNGQWQPQFGGSGGDLGANYGSGSDPDGIQTPATAGTYKVTVNFHTKKYTITP